MKTTVKKQIGWSASIKSKPVKSNSRRKKKLQRSRSNFFSRVKMLSNVLPVEASHHSLDIFERAPLLIFFQCIIRAEIWSSLCSKWNYSGVRIAPISSIYKTSISKWIVGFLELMVPNWNTMQPMLWQLIHHSLFIILYILFSLSVVLLRMASDFLTAFTFKKLSLKQNFHNKEAEDTWLKCQGYSYEEQPDDFTKIVSTIMAAETWESAEISFIGRIASDFFSCDKHLIIGVTLRISFLRNRPNYAIIYDDET